MKSKYISVNQCISELEFCPFCNKRNNIDIGFYNDPWNNSIRTIVDNKQIKCINFVEGKILLAIHLANNIYSLNNQSFQPFMRIGCKSFHWTTTFIIFDKMDNSLYLSIDKLSFFLRDKKLQYNIVSNYLTNTTNISLGDNTMTLQDLQQEAIHFGDFNKKDLIKKIKTLCLLS